MAHEYDEQREIPQFWSWVIIILFSASIMAFGIFVYNVVDEGVRHWDVGQLPDTPAEGEYSTEQPWRSAGPQRQLPRLPEAKGPMPAKPRNIPLRERGERK